MKTKLVWVVLFLIFPALLAAVINFKGGVILGEPDEMVHAEVVRNLINNRIPSYRGVGFYYDLPAYFTVSAILSALIIHDPLISLRFVSLMATLISAAIIFYYLLKKEGLRAAILGGALYFVIPLSVFYLRVGIIEPFLVLGLTGAVCFFDLGRSERKLLFSCLSGLFLGLALLTKYSVLPVLAVMAAYFIIDFIRANRTFYRERYLYVNLHSFLPLAVGLALFLPVLYFFYKHDPVTVKWQTYQVLGLFGGVKQEFRLGRLAEFPWWYSWPVLTMSLAGLAGLLTRFRKYSFLLICAGAMLYVVLSRLPFYPRYSLTLVPFLVVFSALGLSFLKSKKIAAATFVVIFAINAPSLTSAYKSSFQRLIEDSVLAVGKTGAKPAWAFSNYWPNYFGGQMPPVKFAWLTYDGSDLRAFAPGENRDALSILKKDGGVVFLENLYADLTLTQQPGRMRAIDEVRKNYKPDITVKSSSPNFPFSKTFGNSIDVYIFKSL